MRTGARKRRRAGGGAGLLAAATWAAAAAAAQTAPATPEQVIVSWINYNAGNQTLIQHGQTIPFPPTGVSSRTSIAVVVMNRGVGPASLTEIAVSGDSFDVNQIPILPATITGGGELRFNVVFTPTEGLEYVGRLSLTVAGAQRSFLLRGAGTKAVLSIEAADGALLQPGSTILFPNTAAGVGRAIQRLRLRNTGNAETVVGNIQVSGSSFTMLDAPGLPLPMRPGDAVQFGIQFSPREVGDLLGQLRIDTVQYALSGRGTGPDLAMYLTFDGIRLPLRANVPAVVPNTDVGSRRVFAIEVDNTGDETGFVAAVSVGGDGFSLSREARFPLPVRPGETARVEAAFAPLATGVVTGSLVVHDRTFTMIGVGSEPPPLPPVAITGAPARAEVLEQPAIGLELQEPYPYELTGRIVLTFSTETFIDDPAVQFINGSRTAEFRVPAGSTAAVFGAALRSIRMQTGSIAGTITLVAAISVGRFDLTRSSPPVATVEIPAGPPVLRGATLVAKSSKAFDLVVRGAAPSRTVERFEFTLTPAPGVRLQTSTVRVNVAAQFDAWYRSADSRPFGSQFTLVVPFELSSDFSVIQSIEVRAFNALGGSAARRVIVAAE